MLRYITKHARVHNGFNRENLNQHHTRLAIGHELLIKHVPLEHVLIANDKLSKLFAHFKPRDTYGLSDNPLEYVAPSIVQHMPVIIEEIFKRLLKHVKKVKGNEGHQAFARMESNKTNKLDTSGLDAIMSKLQLKSIMRKDKVAKKASKDFDYTEAKREASRVEVVDLMREHTLRKDTVKDTSKVSTANLLSFLNPPVAPLQS